MVDRAPRGGAWLLISCFCTLVLAGCGPAESERAAKHRRALGPISRTEATLDGLPLLRLQTDPAINLDDYTPAQIALGGRKYAAAQAKHRGKTSSTFPKKSFTLKFAEHDALDDDVTGFTSARKVVLISSFDDRSYVRQALALELWNRMDPEHIQIRTAFVSVLLNEEYEGVYLMADHVGEHLMERLGLWEDGDLFQATGSEATFASDATPHSGFTKEEGKPEEGEEGAYEHLDAFVRWLGDADDEELVSDLATHIDVRDYMDWWILANTIDASDSTSKNSFHYRDPRVADPPNVFRCLPWDFNASFGQDWRTRFRRAEGALDRYDGANAIFARLTGSEFFATRLRERFRALLGDELSLPWIQAWLVDARTRLEEAALQDEACWSDAYRQTFASFRGDDTDFGEETAYVNEWIDDRWAFLSAQLGPPEPAGPSPGGVDDEEEEDEEHEHEHEHEE